MRFIPSIRSTPDRSPDRAGAKVDRRGLVVGAGVAGLAAVAARALQRGAVEAPVAVAAKVAVAGGDGYQVTPHVLRYYETAKF